MVCWSEACVCERSALGALGAGRGSLTSSMPCQIGCPLPVNMILTQCAVCATDLGLTLGKKCGRCSALLRGGLSGAALEGRRARQAM